MHACINTCFHLASFLYSYRAQGPKHRDYATRVQAESFHINEDNLAPT